MLFPYLAVTLGGSTCIIGPLEMNTEKMAESFGWKVSSVTYGSVHVDNMCGEETKCSRDAVHLKNWSWDGIIFLQLYLPCCVVAPFCERLFLTCYNQNMSTNGPKKIWSFLASNHENIFAKQRKSTETLRNTLW